MSDQDVYDAANASKVNMHHVYDRPDPKAYFSELSKIEYMLPEHARPVFERLIACRTREGGAPLNILDLGCSYGVNAALLKHGLTMSQLYDHWEQAKGLSHEECLEHARALTANASSDPRVKFIGLDQAKNAVSFALACGVLEAGYALDLEGGSLPQVAAAELARIDLVISTGCVGYITEQTFLRVLPVLDNKRSPWFGNFVLRSFPFNAIEESLAEWGYVTEKLEGQLFVQRQFASNVECKEMVSRLEGIGIDPKGKEEQGTLYAEFFLSRPKQDAIDLPIEDIFTHPTLVTAAA